MTTPSRASLLVKTHKVLKKHYKPVPPPDRPILDHLLYACVLENSSYPAADKAYADVPRAFFDWNEVRVTTVKELAELMRDVFDPPAAAMNVRRILHSVFESTYSFDLESYKKKTIGQALKDLAKFQGVTPFVLAYVNQAALGGHAVPVDQGAMTVLEVIGAVSAKEAASGVVPGMERAIAKNKGIEFGSLLHQLGADLMAKPFAPEVRNVLLSIAPDCKDRLPKRAVKRKPNETVPPAAAPDGERAKTPVPDKDHGKPSPAKTVRDEKHHTSEAPPSAKEKPGDDKPREDKSHDKDRAATRKKETPAAAAGKPAAKKDPVSGEKKKTPADHKHESAAKTTAKPAAKPASTKGLSKLKPR
jgi:endonuclease-3